VNAGFLGDTWWLGGDPLSWTNHTAGYYVVLTESGLKKGAEWTVTLNGKTESSTGTMKFAEANGSFSYSISHVAGFRTATGSYSGGVTVDGANPTAIQVRWVVFTYAIKFAEKGLPSSTPWQVSIDGKVKSSSAASISFSLANGSYPFTVTSTGFAAITDPLSPLNVSAAPETVAVTFS